MRSRKIKNRFIANDGIELDIPIHTNSRSKECFLIYPCIGGTTRAYFIPHEELMKNGYSVVEYHPRAHGRSKGQLSMEVTRHDLYRFLGINNLLETPIVLLAHSAGANAALQLSNSFLKIKKIYLVQPVFDFRESINFMYSNNTQDDFINLVSNWASNKPKLKKILSTTDWLNVTFWYQNSLQNKINQISLPGFNLGDFFENFYLAGLDTGEHLKKYRKKAKIFLSRHDAWYPVKRTEQLALDYDIPVEYIETAHNHFLTDTWDCVWKSILRDPDIVRVGISSNN